MERHAKATRLIATLNRETIDGNLTWEAVDPPTSIRSGTDDLIPVCFIAQYSHRQLVVFERRFQQYSGEYEQFYWNTEICFAILDDDGRILWENSQSSALQDLYSTIGEIVSGVDQLLEDLMNQQGDPSPGSDEFTL